jgi:transitional endoplasmic reticulum ATPase
MSRFLLDQIDALEERYRSAKARGDWEEGWRAMRDAAKVMLLLAARAPDDGIRRQRTDKAEKWIAEARAIKERQAFPAAPKKPEPVPEGGKPGEKPGEKPGSDWLLREKPDVTFDDIAGLTEAKEQIRVRMVYPFLKPDLAKKYGVRRGGGILLYGPPGTGKTMLAKAVAAEIDAPFYSVSPSEIMSKWVGESEQNIARLFREARENAASIIFIDEVEALVPPRGEDAPAVMKRLVPQILQELEGIGTGGKNPLLFVGATNEPWNLDSAILRPGRFDEKVYIPLPDEPARLQILEKNLRDKPLVGVDIPRLVGLTGGYSGADLRALCEKTANTVFLEAVRTGEDRDITMDDFLASLGRMHASVRPEHVARFEVFARGG